MMRSSDILRLHYCPNIMSSYVKSLSYYFKLYAGSLLGIGTTTHTLPFLKNLEHNPHLFIFSLIYTMLYYHPLTKNPQYI